MGGVTAHIDTFVRDNLPPPHLLPDFIFTLPELRYPERLNAVCLLERAVAQGFGDRPAVVWSGGALTYRALLDLSGRIARVLVDDLGLVPGGRVLLHAPNDALTIAVWWAILKAGGVAVTTMPLLRVGELATIAEKAEIDLFLADAALAETVDGARAATGRLGRGLYFGDGGELAGRAAKAEPLPTVPTAAEDAALIAFTSGTTGKPKGCIHFHRDVLAMADTFARHVLKPGPDDVFCGSPPFAFTFGLGGAVVFPAAVAAATALPERPGYDALCAAIDQHKVSALFTAPTAYRALLRDCDPRALSSLRRCVSAGEVLPKATSDTWFEATGLRLIDGIGSTEMIHIFVSASDGDIRPGSTGRAVPGYEARLIDEDDQPIEGPGVGRLAVRGPTGCRYLADPRQANYVTRGWNVTGDLYRRDEDGWFWYVARADDMIISSGYNIGAPEVEQALLTHAAVAEAAVVGWPDEARGQIVKAYVVLHDLGLAGDAVCEELKDHVKRTIAPYKYPRVVEFVSELPKTQTGKLQRFKLRKPSEGV
jgi:2-aminobenzoate-CoA ligase